MTNELEESLPGISEGVRDYLTLAPEADARAISIYLVWVRLLEAQAERQFVRGGMRPAAFTIVRILFFEPEHRKTLTDLAREMAVSVTYITRLSHELQRLGWAERVRDRADRRVTYVQLTPMGEDGCRERLLNVVRIMERTTRGLTDGEKEQFQSLLTRFALAYIETISEGRPIEEQVASPG